MQNNVRRCVVDRIYRLMDALCVALTSIVAWLVKRRLSRLLLGGRKPQQVAIIPLDLHLSDPVLAQEFYHGRFALAGRIVRSGAVSPWLIEPPSPHWEEALHDFGWLRHMRSAKDVLASAHARALVEEWITLSGKTIHHCAWTGHVTARRVISWLSHADMLLSGASPTFQHKFLKMLGLNIRYLRALRPVVSKTQQLETCLSLCFAALALASPPAQLRRAERRLQRALDRHILPDGGHISRNPAVLVPLLTDLLALCHAYQQGHHRIPDAFIIICERIDGFLRFLQHRDQSLAHFNGVGPLLPERLTGLLNIQTPSQPMSIEMPDSGYQRLSYGATTVIVDTGCPPQASQHHWSSSAHAGCLSFEMSSGTHRFIVNCGVDPYGGAELHFAGRLSAAHSTAILNDTSSCQFRHAGLATSLVSAGPDKVRIKHIDAQEYRGFVASHNGYAHSFHLLHQRSMALSKDGNLLQGADRFVKINPKKELPPAVATVRFHLHPDVEVSQLDEKSLRLEVMRADAWVLTCQAEMILEDSIYFCGLQGPVKTRQITFSFDPAAGKEIYWEFRRQIHHQGAKI